MFVSSFTVNSSLAPHEMRGSEYILQLLVLDFRQLLVLAYLDKKSDGFEFPLASKSYFKFHHSILAGGLDLGLSKMSRLQSVKRVKWPPYR